MSYVNLYSIAKSWGDDDPMRELVNEYSQMNPFTIFPFIPANRKDLHEWEMVVDAGTPSWTGYNKGIDASVAQTVFRSERIRQLQDRTVVDIRFKQINEEAFLREINKQTKIKHVAMSNEVAKQIFYGDASADPKKPNGLVHNVPSGNILSAGGSTNLTSVFVAALGEEYVALAYPEGHPTFGIEDTPHIDPPVYVNDSEGKTFAAGIVEHSIYTTLCVQATSYVARIKDIEISASAGDGTGLLTDKLLIDALSAVPDVGQKIIMMNRRAWAQILASAAVNKFVAPADADMISIFPGVKQTYLGYPVVLFDAIQVGENV